MSVAVAAAKPPPGRVWYAVAGLILVATFVVGGWFIFHRVAGAANALTQIVVPGRAALPLAAGSYTIYHESSSTVDGKVYAVPTVSGLRVTVTGPNGSPVALVSPTATSRYNVAGRSGVSLFNFEAAKAGTYRLTAAYDDGRAGPQTVLAVGSGFVGGLLLTILGAFVIMFGGIGGAIAIAVVTFIQRRRARPASP
jgi:hypothetical protein